MALGQADEIVANRTGLAALVDDAATALIFRVVVFAAFSLFLAARLVRRTGNPLNRISLRLPFYEQCYPGAVFALGVSLGTSLSFTSHEGSWSAGHALQVLTIVNFMVVETLWFARRGPGNYVRAFASVVIGLVEGTAFMFCVAYLFTR